MWIHTQVRGAWSEFIRRGKETNRDLEMFGVVNFEKGTVEARSKQTLWLAFFRLGPCQAAHRCRA